MFHVSLYLKMKIKNRKTNNSDQRDINNSDQRDINNSDQRDINYSDQRDINKYLGTIER